MADPQETGTIAHALARHVAGTKFEEIPAHVLTATRHALLDTLGVGWAGSAAPGSAAVRALAVREGGSADATLLAFGDRLPAASAALVNGTLAGALDFDSLHEPSVMHCDIVILPAVLALAERERRSGAELLAALVLGNDLAARLGASTNQNAGWFYSSLHGSLAAAAASARLLGLDAYGIRNAIGIAYSSAAGTRQPIFERSFTKRMQTAFAAQAGVQAALLAGCGVTGPAAVLEGRAGLYAMYEQGDPSVVLDGLGEHWSAPATSIKKFPSCACNHAAIDAALRLVGRHDIAPARIASVEITLPRFAFDLVGAPFRPGATPQVDAQFSVRYSIAAVLLRRRFDVDDILPESVLDPAIRPIAEMVDVRIDETATTLMTPSTVKIVMVDGRRFEERTHSVPGTPEAPLGEREIREKFRACLGRGVRSLDPATADGWAERILALEEVADVRDLMRDLAGGPGQVQSSGERQDLRAVSKPAWRNRRRHREAGRSVP